MKSTWLNDWQAYSSFQLESVFGLSKGSLDQIEILLASYTESDDAGYAFVLYRDQQRLYEVNASHDSQLDFYGQWLPEETSVDALLFRLNKGNLGSIKASDNVFADELREVLKAFLQ